MSHMRASKMPRRRVTAPTLYNLIGNKQAIITALHLETVAAIEARLAPLEGAPAITRGFATGRTVGGATTSPAPRNTVSGAGVPNEVE